MKRRATQLHVTEMRLLKDWARSVGAAFRGEMPYLVGSAVTSREWRDVDVRLILSDEDHAALSKLVDLKRLDMAMSLWGQQTTGLPIDFQVQGMTEANRIEGVRHALAIG